MYTVLSTTSSFGHNAPHLFETLRKKGFELAGSPFGRKLTEEELKELLDQYRPLGLLAGPESV